MFSQAVLVACGPECALEVNHMNSNKNDCWLKGLKEADDLNSVVILQVDLLSRIYCYACTREL